MIYFFADDASLNNYFLASKVTVALQLEDGQRIQKEFEPTTTIFDVLKQCESG